MFCLLALLLALGTASFAQAGSPPKPNQSPEAMTRWSVDDVIGLESARGFQVSPDGKWVVWEKARADMEKNRRLTELYLTSLEDGAEIRLTRGAPDDDSPRWSPDGKLIAFRSARADPDSEGDETPADDDGSEQPEEKVAQIWLINPHGGEPWPLTSLDKGMEQFAWLDAGTLAFTARESESLREKTLEKRKDDSLVAEDESHFTATRLFTIDVATKETRRRSSNDDQIAEFAPSPDGRWVVARHHTSPHYEADARSRPRFFLYDMGAGGAREIFTEPLFFPYGFIWARDGSGFYGLRTRTSDPAQNGAGAETLYWYDMKAGTQREVPLDWPNGIGGTVGYDVTADGFIALLANGPENRLARYTRRGNAYIREFIDDPKASRVESFDVGPDGATVVFTHSTASTPPRAFAGRIAGAKIDSQRPIAPINQKLGTRRMVRAEVTRWKGALGDEVSGILYYPLDYKQDKRYPLVLMIHGGPNAVDLDAFDESWAYAAQLFAGKGAFVLKPNYHGSTNHGQAFAESIKEHYYEYETPDILKGIDSLADKGMVDPRMLGVIGWSNGAILTWELITRTDRFKAAAPGAGDVNWTGDYGNCSFGAWFDNYYLGGPPWEKAQTYIEKSPYFRLGAVKTPTIIFFGTEDRSVDTGQGWEAFRALQQIGRAPVRFILFPGEPHSLEAPSHQRRKLEEEVAWFDKYLFGAVGTGNAAGNEALKEGSPLDRMLNAGKAAHDGARFGVPGHGLLVPETVPWPDAPSGPVEIGRFEVTRAQYAAFDPAYAVSEASANLPASGITFDKARAYCEWLSTQTGQHFRLPNVGEMNRLLDSVSDDSLADVTLDYWAGYALNPDDALKLAPTIAALPGPAPLLKPVGSMPPAKISDLGLVYDLGGNVSEWAADGTVGKALGCDAGRPCDHLSTGLQPAGEYIGFRVMKSH